ncbi:hypothetical protein QTO30_07810 [Yoonia sp. GPGPB17]|uniref:hypothetical protein n=1 Tax=Yoonia sp. GPGPB17 TaxID=3026147 RepID=UPI0030BA6103
MTLAWKAVKDARPNDLGAYAHWWQDKERDFIPPGLRDANKITLELPHHHAWNKGARSRAAAGAFYANGAEVPLPDGAANTDQPTEWSIERTAVKLPEVPNDTVLVGIVDTGISLSNSRFRMADGTTRFVASWQQSAPFQSEQADLPCGNEVYADQINEQLDRHGPSKTLGYVDEVAFNRDLNLTEPVKPGGQRDLEMAAAHGTHVLDLAAGLDPEGDLIGDPARLRLLSVNLPAQYAHGTAGGFLAYFAIYALERLIHLADALWVRNNPCGKAGGYPLVINFSYGMTAGPKDGRHIFEGAIRDILADRNRNQDKAKVPVRLIMPAGNDNLERCAASAVLGGNGARHPSTNYKAQSSIKLPWRILPADSTANFVEIWFEAQNAENLKDLKKRLQVWVTPPGSHKLKLQTLRNRKHQDLGEFARVYADLRPVEGKTKLALLVCVAPTTLDVAQAPIAPAGLWEIHLEYDGAPVDTAFYIQSDQSAVRTSKTGRRSYLDHENYRTYLENGALADTYSYEPDFGYTKDNDNWREFGPVQRRGSHNALATANATENNGEIVVVGGFDDSTGYPASYSSSTDGNRTKPDGRAIISVSYPSENGASLFGLLAAGARDGSVTAYRGTSMATALATRDAAFAFLNAQGAGKRLGTERWFTDRASTAESEAVLGFVTDHWGQYLGWPRIKALKSGVGRIGAPVNDRRWRRLGGTN